MHQLILYITFYFILRVIYIAYCFILLRSLLLEMWNYNKQNILRVVKQVKQNYTTMQEILFYITLKFTIQKFHLSLVTIISALQYIISKRDFFVQFFQYRIQVITFKLNQNHLIVVHWYNPGFYCIFNSVFPVG